MQHVLVTGGAGFIGSHIAEGLLLRGIPEVTILDDFSTGRWANIEDILAQFSRRGWSMERTDQEDLWNIWLSHGSEKRLLRVVPGDVRDLTLLRKLTETVDVIVHQAAIPSVARSVERPLPTHEVNVTGTLTLFEVARERGIRRVVFASSSSVYGDTPTLPKREDMTPAPLSPYAVSKRAAELYGKVFASLYPLEIVALRYFNVYGPRQDPASEYAAVIPRFISRVLQGLPPIIYGDGSQTRDFTFVEDVVEANWRAMNVELQEPFVVMNICGGRQISILELAQTILRIGQKEELEPLFQDPRPGDIKHSLGDPSRAREILGMEAFLPLEEGLHRTFSWFQERLQEAQM